MIRNQNRISRKQNEGGSVVFRDLFNKLLKMKYQFYQSSAPNLAEHPFAKRSGSAQSLAVSEETAIQTDSSDSNDDGSKSKLAFNHGPVFIITFCSVIILFYLVASIIAHYAYREYKGLAEDCAGGSINYKDGNVLYFGIIDKREDDAIEERVERLKR